MSATDGRHPDPAADGPSGALFWAAAVVGWLIIAFGVWGLYDNEGNTMPALLVRWVIGTLLVHDLLLVPVVIAAGALVGWLLPPRARGPVRAALALSALVVLFSYPLWRGFGRRPGDPSALPLDYADSVFKVVAAIWLGTAVVLSLAMVERKTMTDDVDQRSRADTAVLVGLALAAWLLVVAVGRTWGLLLIDQGRQIVLYTPPVLGGYRPSVPAGVWLPALAGAIAIVVVPRLASSLRWGWAVVTATVGAVAWWVSLALVDGRAGLTRGLFWQEDFADLVPRAAASPGAFLRDFVASVPDNPIAVRAHPPGFPLLLALLDRIGLSGPNWAVVLVVVGAASAVPAVLIATRAVAGEDAARRVLPFVVVMPAGLWIVTSADGLFMGAAAWVVALVALASTGTGRRSDVLAVAAGLMASFVAVQSYGLVLMAIPVALVAVWAGRARPVVIAAVVASAVTLALGVWGYWWPSGLFATIDTYHDLGLDRPYSYFLVNNLSAWLLALGPAMAVAVALLRDRRIWVLVGGGVAAAIAADVSGLSNGEVERIWLPFTVWVFVAGAALASRPAMTRVWMAVQVATAVILTAVVGTNW